MVKLRLITWTNIGPWLIGVLLSAAGMFLGYDLGSETARLLGGEPGIWARMGKGFVWGGVIAGLQWPVVRTAGVPPIRFLVASAVGFARVSSWTDHPAILVHWSLHWTGYGSALATFGLCLGVPQWWIFRRQMHAQACGSCLAWRGGCCRERLGPVPVLTCWILSCTAW